MSTNETTACCDVVLTAASAEPASLGEQRDTAQAMLHRDIQCVLPNLRRYAHSLTHDDIDADDLVQGAWRERSGSFTFGRWERT